MPHAAHELTRLIREEIAARGPISLARFMELALYHPIYGYYQQPSKQVGCQGDFYTSVSVGPLFGRLLAFAFADDLDKLPPALPLQLVEAGAHDGQLALDILAWFARHRAQLLERIEYWIVEPSTVRQQRQAELLRPFSTHVRWRQDLRALPGSGITGVIFSNELLDAFPFYRAGWDATAKAWFEWRINATSAGFHWVRACEMISPPLQAELRTPFWRELPADLLAILPNEFTVDLCPAAAQWWREAATCLRQGTMITFDYGLEEDELLAPQRAQGTLRGYHQHRPSPDPLALPGEQDLTAHVNFSALLRSGAAAGLQTDTFQRQGAFLTAIATRVNANLQSFGLWGAEENRQFQTLVHPQHLGGAFRALQQSRGNPTVDVGT